MENVVEVAGLVKDYGGLEALKGVSFNVGAGLIFGLVGRNGSGKTKMIKSLTGQIRPTSGTVKVLGKDAVSDPLGVRRVVGIIPEQEAPPSFLTAEEYLCFVASIRDVKDFKDKMDFWGTLLDFHGQSDMLCKDLSRGNRQKLMISQAFIHDPKVVFIDEPLVNLDPLAQKHVKDFLRGYAKSGNTVFLCTHLLDVVHEICDEVAVLDKGKILAQGDPKMLAGGSSFEDYFLRIVEGSDAGNP